jgi:hypothetical protein
VGGEGGLVVAADPAAVVDPAVGAFDYPAAGLDDEAVVGFGSGHDVNGDAALAAASATVRRCSPYPPRRG